MRSRDEVRLLDSTPNFFRLWSFISCANQVDDGEAGVPALSTLIPANGIQPGRVIRMRTV